MLPSVRSGRGKERLVWIVRRVYGGGMTNATTTRKMAHDLQIGDVFRKNGSRFQVTEPVRPGFYGRGIRITYVGLDRLSGLEGSYVDADLYYFHVED